MTKLDKLENREMASDLMDGRLQGDAFARAVAMVQAEGETRSAWQVNHLIGDVLRFGATAGVTADPAFVDRFRRRFEEAQIPNWTQAEALRAEKTPMPVPARYQGSHSANSSGFRWKMVAGFASLAAVAAVTWGAWSGLGSGAGIQLAKTGTPTLAVANSQGATEGSSGSAATAESQVMIRDPNLDALLAAHKQFGGTSALQMPAGFLRNATFESPSR